VIFKQEFVMVIHRVKKKYFAITVEWLDSDGLVVSGFFSFLHPYVMYPCIKVMDVKEFLPMVKRCENMLLVISNWCPRAAD